VARQPAAVRNVLRFACAVCDTARVELRHRPTSPRNRPTPADDDAARQRTSLVAALAAHRRRPAATTSALGILRATRHQRISKLCIVAPHRP